MRLSAIAAVLTILTSLATAPAGAEIAQRPGWVVTPTVHTYAGLVKRIDAAAKAHNIAIVTRASATRGAWAAYKKKIPGNMVIGLYHPRFAVPMLDASVAAGIEAPIRLYVTENSDGTATLSYKTPSHVFAPYMADGGDKLKKLAADLDALFAALAAQASGK